MFAGASLNPDCALIELKANAKQTKKLSAEQNKKQQKIIKLKSFVRQNTLSILVPHPFAVSDI